MAAAASTWQDSPWARTPPSAALPTLAVCPAGMTTSVWTVVTGRDGELYSMNTKRTGPATCRGPPERLVTKPSTDVWSTTTQAAEKRGSAGVATGAGLSEAAMSAADDRPISNALSMVGPLSSLGL